MNFWKIVVAADVDLEPMAETIRARLVGAWSSKPEVMVQTMSLAELDTDIIEELDAAVLVVDASCEHTPVLRRLTQLEELHIPVVALLDKNPEPGSVFEHTSVLIEGRGVTGPVLCARIHGMLHRQAEVNRLRREVAIARRSHGGLEVEVARIHDDLQLAAHAQRGILPRDMPPVHGVNFASLWRPAHYVSGDIYDVVRLDDDRIGLFLADAVGHGMAAALMTMVISQSLTTRVREGAAWRILDPAEVLGRLNDRMIRRQSEPTQFATAVYGVIDCRTRRLTLAGAGHPPPYLIHADETMRPLETHGGLLGIFRDEAYDQVEVDLEVGDRLLMYTDGFEQAFPRDESAENGTSLPSDRCREEFRKLCSIANPEGMIEAIGRRLDVQSGSLHQADDLTLLCIQAGPPAASSAIPESESVAA